MKKIIFMTILVLASLFIVTFIFAIVAQGADRPLMKRQPVQTRPSVTTTQPPPDEIQTVVPVEDSEHPTVEAEPTDEIKGTPPSYHMYKYSGRMFKYDTVEHCGIRCKVKFAHAYDGWSSSVDGYSDLETLLFFSSDEDLCQELWDLCERGGKAGGARCGPTMENWSRYECTLKYRYGWTRCNGKDMGYEASDLECP